MITVQNVKDAIENDLVRRADSGWSVVSQEYSWHKRADVYFTVVAADPEGGLWSYTIMENDDWGGELSDGPIPVTAVVETKQVVTYRPRLVAKS